MASSSSPILQTLSSWCGLGEGDVGKVYERCTTRPASFVSTIFIACGEQIEDFTVPHPSSRPRSPTREPDSGGGGVLCSWDGDAGEDDLGGGAGDFNGGDRHLDEGDNMGGDGHLEETDLGGGDADLGDDDLGCVPGDGDLGSGDGD